MPKAKKCYKVHITETYGRDVIIAAEDKDEAFEIAEELCNADIIDVMNVGDFGSRNVEVLGTPDEIDLKELSRYERK